MKKSKILILIVLIALMSGNCAKSAEKEVFYDFTTGFFSKYIWRGQNLNDDPVFQPKISANYENFTVGIWGNLDLTNINDKSGDFLEIDYYLDYSNELPGFKGVGYSLGFIYYDFPGATADGTRTPDTFEIYWGLNLDLPLSPSVTVYHDVDEADGSYASLSFGHSIEKITELTPEIHIGLDIGSSLGWGSGSYNNYYWGTDQTKLNDLVFSVSFPIEINGCALVPSLNYVTLLSDDIRHTDVYGNDSDFFYAGISLSKSF
jgi:uncharacterized protein (TIGR02001 family)